MNFCNDEKIANNAYLYEKTVRSGQSLYFTNNVIILGDVNAGAIIEAEGNIIITGKLSGTVHAGVKGNLDAIVYAREFAPAQVRIANLIVRKDDGDNSYANYPEYAMISEDQIIIKKYI